MCKRISSTKVNAGSMADIAFLLLIFFLVTTTINTEVGIDRMLPRLETDSTIGKVHERNILRVLVNEEGKILVDGVSMPLSSLKDSVVDFLDNGGLSKQQPGYCDYCKGKRSLMSSDNPSSAIISLSNHRNTKYGSYIAVQNELVRAYNQLRNRESKRLYGEDFTILEAKVIHNDVSNASRALLKAKIRNIQALYPLKLSEIETQ